MLRAMVLVLLIANAGFYAWTHGWLDAMVGVSPHAGREPERLSRQVRPEAVRILAPGSLPDSPAPSEPRPAPASITPVSAVAESDGVACLQAGPFAAADVADVEAQVHKAVTGLAPGSLVDVKSETPGVWLIYLGRFPNREALQKKQEELRRFPRLVFEEVRDLPQLEPGIVLGRHASRAAAESALDALTERGVRTARVLALNPPSATHTLRVVRVDESLRAQLAGLAVGSSGRTFLPCPSATTTAELAGAR